MLAEYGLSMKDVFKVITDGASNMANAFRDVCSVEVMIQYLEDYNEEETEKTDEVSSDCRNSVLSIESAFPLRVKCFAHDIQLVIVEMFKNYVVPNTGYEK
uniref:Transposase n=1 Tax=Ditylenchus dipsaci TaxID=166011 RepID=A0A915E4N8_9BILA